MHKKKSIELIARGFCAQNGHILLCKNIKAGYHFLPGGHIEQGETAADALVREFQEETGLTPTLGPVLLVHEQSFRTGRTLHHELNVVFHVEHLPAEVHSREPKIGFEWVPMADLPTTDLQPHDIRRWACSDPISAHAPQWLTGPFTTG